MLLKNLPFWAANLAIVYSLAGNLSDLITLS